MSPEFKSNDKKGIEAIISFFIVRRIRCGWIHTFHGDGKDIWVKFVPVFLLYSENLFLMWIVSSLLNGQMPSLYLLIVYLISLGWINM